MVRHDMQQARAKLTSEQIRLSLEIYTPAELEARRKAAAERAAKQAKDATKGASLFDEASHG